MSNRIDNEICAYAGDGTFNEAMLWFASLTNSEIVTHTIRKDGPLTHHNRFMLNDDKTVYGLTWVFREPHYRFFVADKL